MLELIVDCSQFIRSRWIPCSSEEMTDSIGLEQFLDQSQSDSAVGSRYDDWLSIVDNSDNRLVLQSANFFPFYTSRSVAKRHNNLVRRVIAGKHRGQIVLPPNISLEQSARMYVTLQLWTSLSFEIFVSESRVLVNRKWSLYSSIAILIFVSDIRPNTRPCEQSPVLRYFEQFFCISHNSPHKSSNPSGNKD